LPRRQNLLAAEADEVEEQLLEGEGRGRYEKDVQARKGTLSNVKARVIDVAKQAVIPSACEVDFLADELATTEGACAHGALTWLRQSYRVW
jgi:hypothetical protein